MKQRILRDAALVGLAGIIAGISQSLFLVFLGRKLGPADFSVFGIVVSFSFLVVVVFGVFNAIVIQYLSYFEAKSQKEKVASFSKRTLYVLAVIGIIVVVVTEFFAEHIAAAMNITGASSVLVVRLMGFLLLLEIIESGIQGILNGLQKFVPLGMIRIMRSFSILAVGWAAVELGFGVNGALFGLIIGSLILIALGLFVLHREFFVREIGLGKIGFLSYLIKAMPIAISIGILLNVDLILVKYFLSPTDAGFFAAAAIIAGVLFFIDDTIVKVMFPKVANHSSNGADTLPFLRESLQYSLIITGLLVLICIFFPTIISNVIFGSLYEIEGILPWIVLGMFFAGFSSILVMYHLAIKKFIILVPVILAAILKIALVIMFHSSVMQVAVLSCIFQGLFLAILLFLHKDMLLEALKRKRGYFDYADLLQLPQVKSKE